ncbi:MAG: exopolysaccharide biosynthesis polyprenyl glycosylphosphotransferase [bacterium]|nr:exopolysaccharide biosynthesis polyprenyl glycosylphosphotransferase [bacterium]
MEIADKKEPLFLFLGDVAAFYLALWAMLLLRYGKLPDEGVLALHLAPFSFLFAVWVVVFFIAGLYEKHTAFFKSRLPSVILNAALVNAGLAVLFFYYIPTFGITPKTNLFLYLVISFALIVLWRLYGTRFLGARKRENAILIGGGEEMRELRDEVNENARYSLRFTSVIDLDAAGSIDFKRDVLDKIAAEQVSSVVIDITNEKIGPMLPRLYELIFKSVRFFDMHKVYEEIFDRVPLSLVRHNWFLENISSSSVTAYDVLKRIMDITIGAVLGVLSLALYPFVILALKLDDGGPAFSRQTRIGRGGRPITIVKFRTMTLANDEGEWGKVENKVTRVGAFLRKSRIDELPQLWNVLKGDISLIGPRPEFPRAVREYNEKIPYYNVRHLIEPGLSGWAQLYHERHPHHGVDVEETKNKLSYDLYYIKNRSLMLDIAIALKTMKTLLQRAGR